MEAVKNALDELQNSDITSVRNSQENLPLQQAKNERYNAFMQTFASLSKQYVELNKEIKDKQEMYLARHRQSITQRASVTQNERLDKKSDP